MARFWIGTSGWQYDHWRGAFYPPDLAKSRWLDFYANRFRTVELNNSFYRLPSAKSWERWRDTVPDGFQFAIKASRFITHLRRLADCRDSLRLLYEGVRLLGDRRGPVLFQLPPDFERNAVTAARLEAFLELWKPAANTLSSSGTNPGSGPTHSRCYTATEQASAPTTCPANTALPLLRRPSPTSAFTARRRITVASTQKTSSRHGPSVFGILADRQQPSGPTSTTTGLVTRSRTL
jgi:uncharacterized protein DUF72